MSDAAPDLLEHITVLRAQIGDDGAFERLFDRHSEPLLSYLRRFLGNASDAEEIHQDVWLIVYRKIGRLERPGAFRAWLYQIARNRAISRNRRQRREVALEQAPEEQVTVPEVEEDALSGLDLVDLPAALNGLSILHREALTLRFVNGMSYDEIAEVVGCSAGTVRSRIHYGKKALRSCWPKGEKR